MRLGPSLIARYLARNVGAAVLFVLAAFLALFAFFDFINELDDIGRGGYGLSAAAACTSTRVHSLGKKSLYMTIMNASEPRGGRARVGKNARSFFLKTARGVARQLKNFWIPFW